jgi:YHS domain-containing protein
MLKRLLPGIVVLALAGAAFAQEAPARRQGQGQRQARVQVCTMKLEALKKPSEAIKGEFAGKPVLFCCPNCKAAFEKLDDAGKEKAVKKAGLTGRKLTLQKQLDGVEKELKELEPAPADKAPEVAATSKLFCAITGEDIESAEKAAGKTEFNGKTYYFCCGGCVKKFDSDKAKYAKLADEAAAKRNN